MRQNEADADCMAQALRLAERGLGRTWPNPAVGCLVVKDGRVLGRGWTQPPPGAHAEVEALRRAGPAALGATAYVTLEPCSIYGRTPPCTMALLHAGIRRVVAAIEDPDPRVNGGGIAQLRQAGMEVTVGVGREPARALNQGLFRRILDRRPMVTLKIASTKDGRIATRSGASQWITGPAARARGHWLRATHDAIMIGSGTALADDPGLTCRLPGLAARSPVRVVLDGRLRLSPDSQLARSAGAVPLWVVTREGAAAGPLAGPLAGQGAVILEAEPAGGGGLELRQVLALLAARGITRLLVEGGASLATALLRARLVDRLVWFQAPLLIGGDGRAALAALGVERLDQALQLVPESADMLAEDGIATYIVKEP